MKVSKQFLWKSHQWHLKAIGIKESKYNMETGLAQMEQTALKLSYCGVSFNFV